MRSLTLEVRDFESTKIPCPSNKYYDLKLPDCDFDIEIGCGVGLHPILYGKKHPNKTLIAIEHTAEKFEKFLRRYQNNQAPKSIIPVHANAISWISHKVPSQRVSNFILLYPNPYPKLRDLNKRWHAMPFMAKIIDCLKPGGSIQLVTNCQFYALEAKQYFEEFWNLDLVSFSELKEEEASRMEYRTHFEQKYLSRGQTCFDLVYRKPLS